MAYPASVQLNSSDQVANWRPLVQWLLAFPHQIVVTVLQSIRLIIAVLAWFAILFTGRLPQGMADVMAMTLRYELRTNLYIAFLIEDYPPFDFTATAADPGGYAVVVEFSPELEDRNRLTVLIRIIMAIPAVIFAAVIGIIALICSVLAFFAVLFTGRWPAGLRNWVVMSAVIVTRVNAYLALLTDEYPPFRLT